MIKQIIADTNGQNVAVNTDAGEDAALVVATRQHKEYTYHHSYFTNDTYGNSMIQNGAYSGAGLLVHDGTDSADWSTFSEAGTTKWTEDSTDRFYAGAKSIKCDNAPNGSYAQFINATGPGDNVDMTAAYVAVTMWINIDKAWIAGDSVGIWAMLDGSLVGNVVNLEDYFDYTAHDKWHFIAIPLADMGIASSSIDALRIGQLATAGGLGPTFYIDLLRIEATGTPIIYRVRPNASTWLHVKHLKGVFADAYTGIVTVAGATENASLANLSYNKILGMTSTEGLSLRGYRDDVLITGFTFRILSIADMLAFPATRMETMIGDGTNAFITIERTFEPELVLKAEENDELRITLQDDFSALLRMRMSVDGFEEIR